MKPKDHVLRGEEALRAAMLEARTFAMKDVVLEPAELVWWRAQLRRRQAAMEKIGSPVRGVQAFTAAMLLVFAGLVAVLGWGSWLKPLEVRISMPGLCAAAVLIMLAGAVVYLTVERE
jgi:hypothetical protein